MKKVLSAIVLLLLVSSISFAQLGIRGGLSVATWTGGDKSMPLSSFATGMPGSIDPIARAGFAAGVSYKIGLILGLAIEPGVFYVQGGSKYEIPNTSSGTYSISGTITNKYDYLQIPIVVKFTLPIPFLSPYVEGGIAYNILMSAKMAVDMTAKVGTISQSTSAETDMKDNANKSDVSLVLGAGVELFFLDVNARLVLGQSKLDKDAKVDIKNQAFVITAGIRL